MKHIKSQLQYMEGSSNILEGLLTSNKFKHVIKNLRSIFKEQIQSTYIKKLKKSTMKLTNAKLVIDTSKQTFKFKEQLTLILNKLCRSGNWR